MTDLEPRTTSPELSRAESLLRAGRLREAERACRRILAAKPDHGRALHLLALVAERAGRKADAMALLRRAVACAPDDATVHRGLGDLLLGIGRADDALAAYERAHALDPGSPFILMSVGDAWRRKGKPAEAEMAYRAALKLKPDYAFAHNNLGAVLHAMGRTDDAAMEFRRAIALNPDLAAAHNNLGNVLVDQSKRSEAETCYRRAIALDPLTVGLHLNLARLLMGDRRFDDAQAVITAALARTPGEPQLHNALSRVATLRNDLAAGRTAPAIEPSAAAETLGPPSCDTDVARLLARANAEQAAGRLNVAESLCRQALSDAPHQAETLHLLGIIIHKSGRTPEGIEYVRQAIAANAKVALFHSNLCEMCRLAKRPDEALAAGRQAVALDPDLPQAHANLGIACFELGDNEAAAECYRRAVALAPGLAEVHSNLGNVLHAEGRLAEAVEAHRRAIALKPEYADGHNNLGTVLRSLRRHAEAEAHYRQALALKPRDPVILNNLALSILAQQRLDEALALLSQSAQLDPRNAQTFVLLASLLSKQKRYDKATAACERALVLHPGHAEALNVLGCIAFEQGRAADAILHYRKALELMPKLAHAHDNLGNALKAIGKFDDARAAYAAALASDPQLASAYLGLGDLRRYEPSDPTLAAMERLTGNLDALDIQDQMQLLFALGKAYTDLQQHERSFRYLLRGNSMKRRQTDYDEKAMLGLFDRVRSVFTSELLRSRQGSGDPSAVPVLIVGMPRSGTTLIEQILASHPKVFGAGELLDLREVIAAHFDLAAAPAAYPESVPDMPAEVLQRIGAAYADRLRRRAPQAERVTDKMPGNFFHIGLVRLALPNARIIHARRNPVDTCLSCFARLFGGEQQYSYDLAELGRYYRGYASLMAHWRTVLPRAALLDVHYEDVVADLEQQARRIVAHCGLEWDDACLRFYETTRPVHTSSAAQVRQPIYRSAVGRWRSYQQWLRPLLDELAVEDSGADISAG